MPQEARRKDVSQSQGQGWLSVKRNLLKELESIEELQRIYYKDRPSRFHQVSAAVVA